MFVKIMEAFQEQERYTDRHKREAVRKRFVLRPRVVNANNVVDVHPYTFPVNLTEEQTRSLGTKTFCRVVTTKGEVVAAGSVEEVFNVLSSDSTLLKG